MSKKIPNFEFIKKELRKKTYGILSTIDQNGNSHSTSIVYAVSPPESKFALYILTEKHYKKVKNVENNNSISFVIPFTHHFLRFVPANCVQFQGNGEIVPYNNSEAQQAFINGPKILKMNIKQVGKMNSENEDPVFIKILPKKNLYCYGVGLSLMELRKNIESGSYSVLIPQDV